MVVVTTDEIYKALVIFVSRGLRFELAEGLEVLIRHPWIDSNGGSSQTEYERYRRVPELLQSAIATLPDDAKRALTPLCGLGSFASVSAERRHERAAEEYGTSKSYFPKAPKRRLLLQLADVLQSWANENRAVDLLIPGDDMGVITYFDDFVDIPSSLWEDLILNSRSLTMVMNYGSTWRNTYRKVLMQAVEDSLHIEFILPDCSAKSPLLEMHAQRQGISKSAFKAKVDEAISDLCEITQGNASIYASGLAFHHSVHIFDDSSILSLYTLSGRRNKTPAIHVKKGGGMDTFMREDVEHLKSVSNMINPIEK